MKFKKSIVPLVKEAERLGFNMEFTRKGHIKLFKEGCRPVFSPTTPSDNRGVKNTIAQLRRSHQRAF